MNTSIIADVLVFYAGQVIYCVDVEIIEVIEVIEVIETSNVIR